MERQTAMMRRKRTNCEDKGEKNGEEWQDEEDAIDTGHDAATATDNNMAWVDSFILKS